MTRANASATLSMRLAVGHDDPVLAARAPPPGRAHPPAEGSPRRSASNSKLSSASTSAGSNQVPLRERAISYAAGCPCVERKTSTVWARQQIRASSGIPSPEMPIGRPWPSQCSSRFRIAACVALDRSSIRAMSAPRSQRVSTISRPLPRPFTASTSTCHAFAIACPPGTCDIAYDADAFGLVQSFSLCACLRRRSSAPKRLQRRRGVAGAAEVLEQEGIEEVRPLRFAQAEDLPDPHADDAAPDGVPLGLPLGDVQRVGEGGNHLGEANALLWQNARCGPGWRGQVVEIGGHAPGKSKEEASSHWPPPATRALRQTSAEPVTLMRLPRRRRLLAGSTAATHGTMTGDPPADSGAAGARMCRHATACAASWRARYPLEWRSGWPALGSRSGRGPALAQPRVRAPASWYPVPSWSASCPPWRRLRRLAAAAHPPGQEQHNGDADHPGQPLALGGVRVGRGVTQS